jgi:hypothetical protein
MTVLQGDKQDLPIPVVSVLALYIPIGRRKRAYAVVPNKFSQINPAYTVRCFRIIVRMEHFKETISHECHQVSCRHHTGWFRRAKYRAAR